ncbi:hypothetical protein [Streptomyces sp. NPDC001222]|uniref:hypothetical protein n=1 Tax=Streptomyces sp. NPDC001222 TaxID=3364548 RepID=UPI0036C6674E
MNTEQPPSGNGHPHIRHIMDRMSEHHRRAQSEREEAALEDAIDGAAFDLGADIAHPAAGHGESGYDVDTDLGVQPQEP